MASEAPPFWWQKSAWQAWLLWPFSSVYGAVAGWRMDNASRKAVDVPVICVGNFTVGGSGKTPVAIALAAAAKRSGMKPGILSRGYGGTMSGPHRVDPAHDLAKSVGDEPLLLAAAAPVVIATDRAKGAELLVSEGVNLIILDDGFQSQSVAIDLALVVVDSDRAIGNGHVIPGGPLRAPLATQIRHADELLVIGDGSAADPLIRLASRAATPFHLARLKPKRGHGISRSRVYAFAGIGNPEKFWRTVESTGAKLVARKAFPDHHFFADDELRDLMHDAAAEGLELVTTAKDHARLKGGSEIARDMAQKAKVLEVGVEFDPPDVASLLVARAVQRWKERRLSR